MTILARLRSLCAVVFGPVLHVPSALQQPPQTMPNPGTDRDSIFTLRSISWPEPRKRLAPLRGYLSAWTLIALCRSTISLSIRARLYLAGIYS
jgi:hypothetical protein